MIHNNMECHIQPQPWKRAIAIWLYSYGDMTTHYMVDNGYLVERSKVPHGSPLPEPTLELEPHVLKAIVDEAMESVAPEPATVKHLKDAIEVRDKLLNMIVKED